MKKRIKIRDRMVLKDHIEFETFRDGDLQITAEGTDTITCILLKPKCARFLQKWLNYHYPDEEKEEPSSEYDCE